MRVLWGTIIAGVVFASSVGCSSSVATSPAPAFTPSDQPAVTVMSVVDGDTIETSIGTVRIIGIDAPERGQCGYDEASTFVSSLLPPGDSITLALPDGENEADRYGRLLRYVDTAQGVDVGASVLTAGLAVARYDSADGYPAHPRETEYHATQAASVTADGSVTTVACKASADAAEQARVAAEQAAQAAGESAAQQPAGGEWWKQYSSCTKLKKTPNGHPTGPFSRDDPAEAAIYDWFANGTGNNGDGEGDGLACE